MRDLFTGFSYPPFPFGYFPLKGGRCGTCLLVFLTPLSPSGTSPSRGQMRDLFTGFFSYPPSTSGHFPLKGGRCRTCLLVSFPPTHHQSFALRNSRRQSFLPPFDTQVQKLHRLQIKNLLSAEIVLVQRNH